MEGLVDNAKKFMATEQGKNLEAQIEKSTGIDVDKYVSGSGAQGSAPEATGDPQTQDPSTQPPGSSDAFGNPGQSGQFGQEGQYGAVTGQGFGGGLAKTGQVGQDGGPQGVKPDQGKSAYEGMDVYDSTATGGYGKNAAGGAFSRQNQMGADQPGEAGFADDKSDDGNGGGYKTGTSTPGYRQEGDVDAEAAENRMRNQNMNVYGQQADDRGAKGNDYHEAI